MQIGIRTPSGDEQVTPQLAKQIYRYLVKNDYSDDGNKITKSYHDAKQDDALADLPDELKPHA